MKKSWKRVTAVSAVLALGGSLLAGCATGDAEKKQSSASPATSKQGEGAKPTAPVTLNISLTGTGLPLPEADVLKKELDAKLGTNLMLTAIQTAEDYNNQLRVRMSGGNSPDLFQVSNIDMKEYADKGLLLDLTPYLDKELKTAKTFITTLGSDLLKKSTVNGKIYAIPRNGDLPFNSFWIRKDWLDKLKLKMPTTIDELLEVAKAFTEKDPDGNSKKDTYGLTGLEFNAFAPVLGAFGVSDMFSSGVFYGKDGKLMNAFNDPAMPQALAFIQKMIDANVVDPEFMTNKGSNVQQKAFQGKAGIVNMAWTDIAKDEMVNQYKTVNPNAEWVQLPAPKGPAGQFDGSFDFDKPSRLMAIPKSLEKDQVKLNKVFEYINYISSQEGNNLVMYGIEGKHYNLKDGKVSMTELLAKEGNHFYMYQITGRPNDQYLSTKFPNQKAIIEFAAKAQRIRLFDSSVVPPAGFNKADADRYAAEELVKFVYGKRPISEYSDFLKTLEGTFKYKQYTEAAEKQIKEQGLIK
jgi:putative aldouronate transport system substrate-binding protein